MNNTTRKNKIIHLTTNTGHSSERDLNDICKNTYKYFRDFLKDYTLEDNKYVCNQTILGTSIVVSVINQNNKNEFLITLTGKCLEQTNLCKPDIIESTLSVNEDGDFDFSEPIIMGEIITYIYSTILKYNFFNNNKE